MSSKTFHYEGDGLSYTVVVTGTAGGVKAAITVDEGNMDVNGLYWGDDDFTGKSVNLGGPLNMNGSGSELDGKAIQWDDAKKLSHPGLGSEGTDKETYLIKGETLTVELDGVSLDDIDILGIRATSVGTKKEDSIKGVSDAKELEDDDDYYDDDPKDQNAPPDAVKDVFTGDFNEAVEGNVLTNDSDPDGDDLKVIDNSDPKNGSVVVKQDGTFVYTPDTGFSGSDKFTYTITDGNGGQDTAKVYIKIKDEPEVEPNLPPDAVKDYFTGDFGEPVSGSVLGNDSDPENDPLTVIGNTEPANGTVALSPNGQFIYLPDQGFSGKDSFTYTITDGNGGQDTAKVYIKIKDEPPEDPNAPPVAVDDGFTGDFNVAIEGSVLGNDTDPDGDDLTVIGNSQPSNGSVVINGAGQFIYVPTQGFTGEDSFTYTISDGNGGTDTATVTLLVGDAPNNPPDAENDFFTGEFGEDIKGTVLDNDSDPDGDDLSVISNTKPENGKVVMKPDGSFTYTPDDGFTGEDSFTYTITDGNDGQDKATVNLFVQADPKDCPPKNAPPDAVKDIFVGEFDTEFTGNVLDNDSDPDGDPLSVLSNTQPKNGHVVMKPDGTFTYTPDTGFFGDDTFKYVVTDGRGGTDKTTVHITVPCLAAGTLVTTSEGLKPVEEIGIGDKVLTRDDGFQAVLWAGSRVLDAAELARNPDFVSVMIRAGALGSNLPRRDLRVSPGHRMLVSGAHAEVMFGERDVLIAASDLVGQPGISFDPRPVTYVHIMFDTHQIIDSEGAWSESFQPADVTLNGLDDEQRDELLALFPELASRKGQHGYAAARRVLARHESRALLGL